MLIYNASEGEINRAVIPGVRLYEIEPKNKKGTTWRVKLRADGPRYARLGKKRRKDGRLYKLSSCLCWHGFRDFLEYFFTANPEGRVKTALADYQGREDFRQKFTETGDRNIRSPMEWLSLADACECENENLPSRQGSLDLGERQ